LFGFQVKEREMKQQLEEREESALGMKETFMTLQQEVDGKTKRLKKLANRLQSMERELTDSKIEFAREREDLTLMQNNFTR
jgi:kinesin family protein 3/17